MLFKLPDKDRKNFGQASLPTTFSYQMIRCGLPEDIGFTPRCLIRKKRWAVPLPRRFGGFDGLESVPRLQTTFDGNDGSDRAHKHGLPEVRQHRSDEDGRGEMGRQQPRNSCTRKPVGQIIRPFPKYRRGIVMYHHVKKLMFTVRVD